MAAIEVVVHVKRRMFPQTYNGTVKTKGSSPEFKKEMFLPDEVREKMAGESEAYFKVMKDGDKLTFMGTTSKPSDWDWDDNMFCY